MKELSKEMDFMGMEERIWQIREDLPGDALQSAKLVKAAFENNWQEVQTLLEAGADPRICRRGDAFGVESALYFSLRAEQFDIAEKLYNAGDRLDDLVTEDQAPLPPAVLDFLAFSMRSGRNYFYDESKTLSECCRCSAFEQIEKLIPSADQKELSKAFFNTVCAWVTNFKKTNVYTPILEKLLDRGALLSQKNKAEIFEIFRRRFSHCPKPLHPGQEALDQITALISKA